MQLCEFHQLFLRQARPQSLIPSPTAAPILGNVSDERSTIVAVGRTDGRPLRAVLAPLHGYQTHGSLPNLLCGLTFSVAPALFAYHPTPRSSIIRYTLFESRIEVKPEYLNPDSLAPPAAPFTYVVKCGSVVYLSGHVAFDENNKVVGPGDPRRQAEQCWDNIELAVEGAGGTLANVVKIQVFLKDIRFAEAEQTVRVERFQGMRLPACTLVEVSNLGMPELLMEIDTVAVLD